MRDVDAHFVAYIDDVECAKYVGSSRLNLVVFAPVDIGRATLPSAIDHSARLVIGKLTMFGSITDVVSRRLNLLNDLFSILESCF